MSVLFRGIFCFALHDVLGDLVEIRVEFEHCSQRFGWLDHELRGQKPLFGGTPKKPYRIVAIDLFLRERDAVRKIFVIGFGKFS